MPLIADMENLREAFLRAARGKALRHEVVLFRGNLEWHLLHIHSQMLNGQYEFGKYRYFQIREPKLRTICAARFEERVAQHAMMRILHPVFDRYQIYDSYACRIGKGTYKAIDRARLFAQRYKWFLKMDVCKYFDSIDHHLLLVQLNGLLKDASLMKMIRQLVESYSTAEGKGLPIGNLSSQYFANHYLAVADHYAMEQLHVPAMVRYMDDIVVFGNELLELKRIADNISHYISEHLLLSLHPPIINQCSMGLPFLGYVVYPDRLRLNQHSRHRFRKKVALFDRLLRYGVLTEEECRVRYTSMLAYVKKANVENFLKVCSMN